MATKYSLLLVVLLMFLGQSSAMASGVSASTSPMTDEEKIEWLWIDTLNHRVLLMHQNKPFKIFEGAAFGLGGIGRKHGRGDKVTPRGFYRIGWANDHSKYRRFYGLSYPSINDANLAIVQKKISMKEYQAIIEAHQNGKVPPQDTALGGQVGIHGLGSKPLSVHQALNWTFGCIALTNQQIDELSKNIKLGTFVFIG